MSRAFPKTTLHSSLSEKWLFKLSIEPQRADRPQLRNIRWRFEQAGLTAPQGDGFYEITQVGRLRLAEWMRLRSR